MNDSSRSLSVLFFVSPLQDAISTGDRLFTECQVVCRVLFFGHSVKMSLPSVFFYTRQRSSLPSVFFTLGKQACLPSVFFTLGKENFKAHFEAVN